LEQNNAILDLNTFSKILFEFLKTIELLLKLGNYQPAEITVVYPGYSFPI